MSSPQKENGYTAIANELMDALCRTRIPGEVRQVLDFIIRKTYGYNKAADRIPLSQFVTGTGLQKPNISRSLRTLIDMNIITVINTDNIINTDNRKIKSYGINKDYESWRPSLSKLITLSKPTTSVIKTDNKSLSILSTSKDNTKDNTKTRKEDLSSTEFKRMSKDRILKLYQSLKTSQEPWAVSFREFYLAYPRKKDPYQAFTTWIKGGFWLNGDLSKIMEGARREAEKYRRSDSEERKFFLFPSTYLNKRRWEDEDDDLTKEDPKAKMQRLIEEGERKRREQEHERDPE